MKPAHETRHGARSGNSPDAPSADPLVEFLARLMDSRFRVPGTSLRFGLDPLLGLIPGLGDSASALVSVLLLLKSARHGLPRVVMIRMAVNVLLNAAIGAIPVAGDLFSFWFKANQINYQLLQKHAGPLRRSTVADWVFLLGLSLALCLILALVFVAIALLLSKLRGALFPSA